MPYAEEPCVRARTSGEIRTGVQHLEVTEEEAGQRLDNYLRSAFSGSVPRSRIYRIIRQGRSAGQRQARRRRRPGSRLDDRVRVPAGPACRPRGRRRLPGRRSWSASAAAIVHEDDRLLVLDKPAGRRRARGERRELRRHRGAARAAARGAPRAGAPAGPRHERVPAGGAQRAPRCAPCTRCCARTVSRSATWRCCRASGSSATKRHRCPAAHRHARGR